MSGYTVLFAGGGTGGHLMPALAIAEAMVRLDRKVQPYFVGALRGVEAHVLPARPWRHTLLPFEPLYRRQWWKNWRLPISIVRTMTGIHAILRKEKPVLAVGTGGYASAPALWAASSKGIPCVLQEQNAFPGLATRQLARRSRQIHLGFPEGRAYLNPGPQTQIFDTGNPIVPPPPGSADREKDLIKARQGFDARKPLVLVLGGSQGSLAINQVIAQSLLSGAWPADTQMVWQTGAATYDRFKDVTAGGIRIAPFLDPISDAYAAADLVVCRAGAMTLAEVAAWGLPSILIPLPTAAANHQWTNAKALADAGSAVLMEQDSLTPASLGQAVAGLLKDTGRLIRLAENALARARPDAAENIAKAALALI